MQDKFSSFSVLAKVPVKKAYKIYLNNFIKS